MQPCRQFFSDTRTCVIVPTYNNCGTVISVLERLQPYVEDIIVVNDGSTDGTLALLEAYAQPITIVSYPDNQGKGNALREGFRKAVEMGFDNAITIDSDGQHYPEDLPLFAEAMRQNPGALIVGNRKLHQANMPGGNTFANYFSNFWFMVQTWQYLPDTQTGYRVYPLHDLHGLNLLTCRYEAELELLVYASWSGVKLTSTPIRVYYPPAGERVSHFRPLYDFTRISILNTVLCVLCLCFGWWSILWFRLTTHRFRRVLITRLCLLIGGFVAMLVSLPLVCVFRLLWGDSERHKLIYHRILCRYFHWILYSIPGVRINIRNPHGEAFDRPSVIISNHQSNLDLLTILTLSPRIVALTNQRVWNYWLYAPVLRYLEYYPATEGLDNSQDHIESLLERGYSVVIFPEGTRSEDCSILKFKRGAFYLADNLKADILPIYVTGAGKVLPKNEMVLYPGEVRLEIGQRVAADDTSMGGNYREKTRAWHQHYLRRFTLTLMLCLVSLLSVAQVHRPKHLYEYPSEGSDVAVVVCPGGSYSWLDRKTEGHDVARWLQSQGISAYVLYYRVQGGFSFASGYRYVLRGHQYPDAQDDLTCAIVWLRANADSLHLDPHRIGAMGFSAGGHLVASAGALFPDESRPDFVVPVYPVVTLSQQPYVHKRSRRALLGEYRKHSRKWRDSLSLERHVTSSMPPVFLVNCKDDPIVHYHNSELLDSALTANGIPHEYHQYEHGGHGFGSDTIKAGEEAITWKRLFIDWLHTLYK
ncbi:MAG: glycosyltransferase [Bacteroidales bacterium]|nr:glycosyltransferase [Candidatus Liminaster caballi]